MASSLLLRVPAYFLVVRVAGWLLASAVAAVDLAVWLFGCLRNMSNAGADENLTILDDAGLNGLKARFRQAAKTGRACEQFHVAQLRQRIEVKPGKSVRAELFVPSAGANRRVALVCTHPWAVMGGDMNNNVPAFLASNFARLGFITAKFDFRSGTFSRGSAEIEDVKAVCRHLQGLDNPPEAIYLLGYSYGSMIANASVDTMDIIKGFVGISTPFSVFWALSLFNGKSLLEKSYTSKPKLLLSGSSDNFTSLAAFRSRFAGFPQPREGFVVEGKDHFWFGDEWILFTLIHDWLLAQESNTAGSAGTDGGGAEKAAQDGSIAAATAGGGAPAKPPTATTSSTL